MTTDTNTPDEQVQNTSQQQVPSGYVEQARFNGLVQKVETLTLSERKAKDDLALKTSEYEQLKMQLDAKDTEKTIAVSERDKKLQSLLEAQTAAEKELSNLRAMQRKVKVAKAMGRSDLLEIMDAIPNLEDEEALKSVFETFTGYADKQVKQREKELLSGITPPVSSTQTTAQVPASKDGWQKFINSKPLGSAERETAQDQYWDWLTAQNS
jgi:hypothetical protein